MASELEKAEKKALELIARAEQCSTGLKRKLEMRGISPQTAEEVVFRLMEQNLIDDARYARLWLHTRVRLTRTPKRLIVSLCNKGISREEAETALEAVFNTDSNGEDIELAMLKRFAAKQAKKDERKGKDSLTSLKYLLKSEGFSAEAIEQFFQI